MSKMPWDKKLDEYPILLVEDNPDDVMITKRAMKEGQIQNELFVVHDGEEALKFLRKKGEYESSPIPVIILLDLKMPKVDGFQVIEEIRRDESLKSIPIVVLTSSEQEEDVKLAYKLGANSYIVKPLNFESLTKTVVAIKEYWLTISKIPTE